MLRRCIVFRSAALLRRFPTDTAVVVAPHGAPMLTIDLSFNNATKSMLRPVEEPLGKTLARMRMINTAPRSKGSKKVTAAELLADAPPAMLLDEEGQPIGEDVPNSEAWAHAATLVIGETKIRIKYNLPTVTGVTPPSVV